MEMSETMGKIDQLLKSAAEEADQSNSISRGTSQGRGSIDPLLRGSSAAMDYAGDTGVGSGGAACIDVTALQKINEGQKERVLRSLKESAPHALKLQQLRKADRQLGEETIFYKKCYRRVTKELYYILSLFAVVVSGIVAAVAQTSVFTCDVLWAADAGMLLVAIASGLGVWDRLRAMSKHRAETRISQTRQNAVYDRIDEMLRRGDACNLDLLQPHHHLPTPAFARSTRICCLERTCFLSPHFILALLFLGSISAISIASVHSMLCGPRCHCPGR